MHCLPLCPYRYVLCACVRACVRARVCRGEGVTRCRHCISDRLHDTAIPRYEMLSGGVCTAEMRPLSTSGWLGDITVL